MIFPWSKVRAACWWALDNLPVLVGSLLLSAVRAGVKLLIFAVPTAYVAEWCDVPPTWKATAFVIFCIIWSDCVLNIRQDRSAKAGESIAANNHRTASAVMTPAEVAAAARELSRKH